MSSDSTKLLPLAWDVRVEYGADGQHTGDYYCVSATFKGDAELEAMDSYRDRGLNPQRAFAHPAKCNRAACASRRAHCVHADNGRAYCAKCARKINEANPGLCSWPTSGPRSFVAILWAEDGSLLSGCLRRYVSSRWGLRADAESFVHTSTEVNALSGRKVLHKVVPSYLPPEIFPHCPGALAQALHGICFSCRKEVTMEDARRWRPPADETQDSPAQTKETARPEGCVQDADRARDAAGPEAPTQRPR